MDYRLLLFLFAVISTVVCERFENSNGTGSEPPDAVSARKGRALYADVVACAIFKDTSCFLDVADRYLGNQRAQLLAEADRQVLARSMGRADAAEEAKPEEKPSQLAKVIKRILEELAEVFNEGIGGFFRSTRGNEEIEEDEEETGVSNTAVSEAGNKQGRALEESRKKKKKKGKLHAIIKTIVIAVVLFFKFKILLKLLAAGLQIKFFLVALASLILNAARFYLDYKKGKEPQKVIYYEHAQHQHHYEGGEDDWSSSSPGSSYWGRSYDEEEEASAQDLAYAKQKPSGTKYSRVDDKPNFSWG